jgi:hypothetical protein
VTNRGSAKGLRQFLDAEQQHAWLEGEAKPVDGERPEQSLEQRFKYTARFEKLLQRPQAQDVLGILRLYAETCLPLPRATERFYWSVSCLPTSPDKPLVRVNAGWMELFALHPDDNIPPLDFEGRGTARRVVEGGLRARIILHLSDFTADGSPEPDHLDTALLESCVERPGACPERSRRVSHFLWKADTFGVKVRTAAAIRQFLADPRGLRAIRRFNLTHMNRGRNAYQASHCYSLADHMIGD